MNEDFGVGRPRPARPAAGPRNRISYATHDRNNLAGRLSVAKAETTEPKDKVVAVAVDEDTVEDTLVSTPVASNKAGKPSIDDVTKDTMEDTEVIGDGTDKDTGPPKDAWYKRWVSKLTPKQWLMVLTAILLIVAGGTSWILTRPAKAASVSIVKTPKPKPKPIPEAPTSPLTGLEVSADDAKHIVTGVMIENSVDARPQSGLDKAGVVYEAIAEYGITRFLALFQEGQPGNIGPVRSVRPYYIDWARSFDAPIAHVGGSPEALQKLKTDGGKDLDQFFNSDSYRRVGTRFAPHNVYTTMANLNQLEAGKGWTASTFTGFDRKKVRDVKPPATPTTKSINIAISGPTYNVHYEYDPAKNIYMRTMAGTPHIDAETHNQLTPKVVIGLVTGYSLEADQYHSSYQITGSNKAYIFQEGTATEVTWKRDTPSSQYTFTDTAGKPFKLDPGQTWITVVSDPTAVTYAP
jgi:hypothetical protein